MALIQWNDDLSVNVAKIDMQHQGLVGMINELDDAMQQGKGTDVIGEIIDNLIGYAETHFKTEEMYFDRFGYPFSGIHKKEHSDFTKKVVAFKESFDAGTIGLSIPVMHFLGNWLKNHIKDSDRKFGPFFNQKGLQ